MSESSTASAIERMEVPAEPVPSPVVVDVMRPVGGVPDGAPLLVWLHGGGGGEQFAERCRLAFERAWTSGVLPPLTVAMPH